MHVPVLIIGAGPVGLALAGDLAWRGIRCHVVEKTDGSIYQPKMDAVGTRTMEFCRRWGIAPRIEQSPYPRDYPQDNVYVTSLRGYELGREPIPSLADSAPPPQSPTQRERCPQDMFDPILVEFARSFDEVSLRYNCEMTDFEQDASRVAARVHHDDGIQETITADYMVGTDGASSSVRDRLGITMSGRGLLTYTTNVVFRCDDLVAMHDKGRAYRFIMIGPEGTWATLVAINGANRWRFSIIGSEQVHIWTREEIVDAIHRAVGIVFDFEIESILPWIRRELVADSYGHGRVYIAGDAAHMTSPTGGLGMNTGIGDAVDLSWKLQAVLQGWGGPRLLRSYSEERGPIARRITTESTANLMAMLSPRKNPNPHLLEAGAEGDRARNDLGVYFTEAMKREWFSLGLHLGLRYDRSTICVPDGTDAPPTPVSSYSPTARPGARAPHVWLRDGRSTLDLFGHSFVLLKLGDSPPSGDGILAVAARGGVPIRAVDIDQEDVHEAYERSLVLVRPDGYVAWRADWEPQDPEALLETVCGFHVGDRAVSSVGVSE